MTQHLAGREDVLSKYRVDKNSPIPLYYQLSQLIRQSIESGELKPGEQIPTEFELERELGISRATVRRAISDLVYEGLVVRQRAKGTIVAKKRLKKVLERLGSFTNEIMKQNLYIFPATGIQSNRCASPNGRIVGTTLGRTSLLFKTSQNNRQGPGMCGGLVRFVSQVPKPGQILL